MKRLLWVAAFFLVSCPSVFSMDGESGVGSSAFRRVPAKQMTMTVTASDFVLVEVAEGCNSQQGDALERLHAAGRRLSPPPAQGHLSTSESDEESMRLRTCAIMSQGAGFSSACDHNRYAVQQPTSSLERLREAGRVMQVVSVRGVLDALAQEQETRMQRAAEGRQEVQPDEHTVVGGPDTGERQSSPSPDGMMAVDGGDDDEEEAEQSAPADFNRDGVQGALQQWLDALKNKPAGDAAEAVAAMMEALATILGVEDSQRFGGYVEDFVAGTHGQEDFVVMLQGDGINLSAEHAEQFAELLLEARAQVVREIAASPAFSDAVAVAKNEDGEEGSGLGSVMLIGGAVFFGLILSMVLNSSAA